MISAGEFVPFTQQVGMQNPALLALGGHNGEHLDSLADRSVPIANVGALAVFALKLPP
jgi:hypothetical protein